MGLPQVEIRIGDSNLDPAKRTPSWDLIGDFPLGPPSDLGRTAVARNPIEQQKRDHPTKPHPTDPGTSPCPKFRQPSCAQIIWRLDLAFLVTTCIGTLHKWSQNQPNIQRNRRPPCPIRSRPAKPQPKRTATQPNRSAPLFTFAQYYIRYIGVQPQAGKPICARLAPS